MPPLPARYVDFAAWMRQRLDGPEGKRDLAWWKEALEGAPDLLELPRDRQRPAVPTFRSRSARGWIPAEVAKRLRATCLEAGITEFAYLHCIFAALLQRYTGQQDLVIGAPVAGRPHPALERVVGLFVNTIPIRLTIDPDESFRALISRARGQILDALEHSGTPFARIVAALGPARQYAHNPLFQVMFAYQNTPSSEASWGQLQVDRRQSDRLASPFDLTLSLAPRGDSIGMLAEYATDLFDEERVAGLLRHYRILLEAALSDPGRAVGDLPIFDEAERAGVLRLGEGPKASASLLTFTELVRTQTRQRPEAAALRFGGAAMTYSDLLAASERAARGLRARGVCRGDIVAICADRGPDLIVGVLGIVLAGAAFVPLDPTYPVERLVYMLQDSGARALLIAAELRDSLPTCVAPTVTLDEIHAEQEGDVDLPTLSPDDAAYVIYTSGSTGRPKGAVLLHSGLVNVALAQQERFGVGPGDRMTQFSSLSFDAFVFELAMAFGSGACLCLGAREELLPGEPLAAFLRRERITITTLPPSALAALPTGDFPHLRTITVAGEACPERLVEAWAPGRRFFNLYGPTETTIWATVAECRAGGGRPAIGRPIRNTTCRVLDDRGRLAPAGVPGELYLGGAGLARCYLNRPELTDERFVPDPFSADPGARLYRTGDLVRWNREGDLEFLGRADDQVKIRGHRIEPGEVAACLAQHPGVREAVVLAREDEAGDPQLWAYATRMEGARCTATELRQHVQSRLPRFMTPARVMLLSEFPLTPSGKIDRDRLPRSEQGTPADAARPAATPTEAVIERIWCELLGAESVDVRASFFDLGGHSLLITRALARIREALGVDVPVREMFRGPTIEALAGEVDRLKAAGDGQAADRRAIRRVAREAYRLRREGEA